MSDIEPGQPELESIGNEVAKILSENPHSLYGKSNPFVNWDGHDNNDVLKNLARGIGNERAFDLLFRDKFRLDGSGFSSLSVNPVNETASFINDGAIVTYTRNHFGPTEADAISRLTTTQDISDPAKDVWILDETSGFFAYGWIPNRKTLGDPRASRNFVWGVVGDNESRTKLRDLIAQGSQVNPGFIYDTVLPTMYPDAFRHDKVDRQVVEQIFDPSDRRFADYLDTRGLSTQKLQRHIEQPQVQASPKQEPAQQKGLFGKLFGKSATQIEVAEPITTTSILTGADLLDATEKDLYGQYPMLLDAVRDLIGSRSDTLMTSDDIAEICQSLEVKMRQRVLDDPDIYIDAVDKFAAPKRDTPCGQLEILHSVPGR